MITARTKTFFAASNVMCRTFLISNAKIMMSITSPATPVPHRVFIQVFCFRTQCGPQLVFYSFQAAGASGRGVVSKQALTHHLTTWKVTEVHLYIVKVNAHPIKFFISGHRVGSIFSLLSSGPIFSRSVKALISMSLMYIPGE